MHEPEPFDTILQRANAGDADAQNEVGCRILSQSAPGARAEAEMWFRRSAEQGLPEAKHNLGVLFLNEGRVRPEAATWFWDAAKHEWLPSVFALGAIHHDEGDIEGAIQLFEIAAKRGDAGAQDALGRIYFDRESESDMVNARRWSELAAAQGVADAQTRLGMIFHEGRGTPRDPKRAAACFLDAANQGDPGAQLMIGGMYDGGIGVVCDKVEAAQWLMRSAGQGSELAQALLAAVVKELQPHEVEKAEQRARQPLPLTTVPRE